MQTIRPLSKLPILVLGKAQFERTPEFTWVNEDTCENCNAASIQNRQFRKRSIQFIRNLLLIGLSLTLISCSWSQTHDNSIYVKASLTDGKTNFKTKNYAAAYRQLLPLAVKGNKEAQYAIGYMYLHGKGIDKNPELAENWLKKAAKQGETHALAELALLKIKKI